MGFIWPIKQPIHAPHTSDLPDDRSKREKQASGIMNVGLWIIQISEKRRSRFCFCFSFGKLAQVTKKIELEELISAKPY